MKMSNHLHLFLILVFVLSVQYCHTLDNGLAKTPPMGWMSWERFRCTIDCKDYPSECIGERLFMEMADVMMLEGYYAVGYDSVIIDDCWMNKTRDKNQQLIPSPDRFPHGIPTLADYIHSLKMKLGIYLSYGNYTCCRFPGTMYHETDDANRIASWGVKVDGCGSNIDQKNKGYVMFKDALNQTDRPIVYSCSWPDYVRLANLSIDYNLTMHTCNLWRNYDDIQDSYGSMIDIVNYYYKNIKTLIPFGGPHHWHDPDMLIIGDYSLSYEESKTQMAFWSMFAAPLIMSNDLRKISDEMKSILLNKEVIEVDQDPLGTMGYPLDNPPKDCQIWLRPMYNGDTVCLFFNGKRNGVPTTLTLDFQKAGLKFTKASIRDLFLHSNLGIFENKFSARVNIHGVVMVRMTPIA